METMIAIEFREYLFQKCQTKHSGKDPDKG